LIDNYNVYHYSKQEIFQLILKGAAFCVIFGILFYNNFLGILILLFFLPVYIKSEKLNYIKKRKWKLNIEFGDGLSGLSAALNAGYSVENAFYQAVLDLKQMYGEESLIINEFSTIVKKLKMNQNLEDILNDFGERSGVEDIKNFSEVFQTAKRTGGDLIRVIRTTEKTIRDKIDVEREIQTMITGKRLESRIMNIMPCGIIGYLRLSSPHFLDPLYGNIMGVAVMTAMLICYYAVTLLTNKLIDIKV
jgi:tight adherence protein B